MQHLRYWPKTRQQPKTTQGHSNMKLKVLAALAAASFACALPARADDFPSHSLTMIIPFAAGGPTDILGRIVAARMGEVLGQTVIVENVAGAGGMTGSARVANATPDGYQFVLGTVGTHAQGQTLYKTPALQCGDRFHAGRPDRHRSAGARRRARICRSTISRNSSPTPRSIRRRCNLPRPASARRCISAACF